MNEKSANKIQRENIEKVVKALANLCFGDKNHPKFGISWIALVNSLIA